MESISKLKERPAANIPDGQKQVLTSKTTTTELVCCLTCTKVAIKGSFEEDQTTLPTFPDFMSEATCSKGFSW
jgi:hypothetical protein